MAKLDLWLESWIMRKFEHEPEWADVGRMTCIQYAYPF